MRPSRLTLTIVAVGSLLAVVPVVAWGRLWPLLAVFWGLVALGMGTDLVVGPSPRRLSCRVLTPSLLYIGGNAEAVVELTLGSSGVRFEMAVDLSDLLVPQPIVAGRFVAGKARVGVCLAARRRGRARLERIWLRYGCGFGLVERVARVEVDREIAVVPDVAPVRAAAERLASDRHYRAGLRIERYIGDGTEFDSLKELVPGDETRTIEWRSSAKHKKLLCRQFRAERNHQVVLALDTGRLMSEPIAGAVPKLDHALNAALLFAYICLRAGDRVGMYTFDAKVGLFVAPQAGTAFHRTLGHLSSGIDYSDTETNFTLGLTVLSQRLRRRSLVLVLTDFVDTVSAELMLDNLDRLARRHLVVFVSLRDPDLERIAAAPPLGALALERSVVAGSYLRERDVVLGRLARHGIFPIDAPPAAVGARMINRYLEIKRRELI